MCWFFIVTKLLMLKILLAGLMGFTMASRYDYGYHPSAEEFDNLLRETRRTWTHSFLKEARDRMLEIPKQKEFLENRAKSEQRYFVPKFHYNNGDRKFQHFTQNDLPSPSFQQDLQFSSSQKHPVPLQNIGSSLDFNYFSNEIPKPFQQHQSYINSPSALTTTTTNKPVLDTKRFTSHLPEINMKPIDKPDFLNSNKYSLNNLYKNNTEGHFPIYFTNPATGIVYAITEVGKSTKNITKNNGAIPIFITKEQYERDIFQLRNEYEQKCQMSVSSFTTARPQIIRITKAPSNSFLTITSKYGATSVTKSPPLKRPSPVVVKTELTVKDKTPLTTTARPLRKKKKKNKIKNKVKKQKHPPGRKPVQTTVRPPMANQPQDPAIIIGSRTTTKKPFVNNEKLSTQLEKPNFDNIFSSKPQITNVKPNLIFKNHQVRKRSLREERATSYTLDSESSQRGNFNSLTISNTATTFTEPIVTQIRPPIFVKKVRTPPEIFNNFDKLKFSNKYNSTKIKVQNLENLNQNFPVAKSDIERTKIVKNKNFINENRKENESENLKSAKPNNLKINPSNPTNHKHRISKRSAEDPAKSKPTLPKFIKKSSITTNLVLNQTHLNTTTQIKESPKMKNSNQTNGLKKRSSKRSKLLKKRKRLAKLKLNKNLNSTQTSAFNKTQINSNITTTPRSIELNKKESNNKLKMARKDQDSEYYFFDSYDEDEEDDDDDDDDDEDEYDDDEEEDNDEEQNNHPDDILAYDEGPPQTFTSETQISLEDLSEKPSKETNISPEDDTAAEDLPINRVNTKHPSSLDYEQDKLRLKTKSSYMKKRIRRRPAQTKIEEDYDDDEDDEDENSMSSNIGGFFRMIFYPIQVVMGSVMDSMSGKNAEDEEDSNFNPYTQYTSYHNTLKQQSNIDDYDEDYDNNDSSSSSLSSWLTSWFGLNRRNKKIGSTTAAPSLEKPTKSSSWLPSWMAFGANDRVSTDAASNEDYDDYDKWFASWFGETKPKARKRTTTTTSTTTQLPHVPILTIVDPMKNPQNWIGILANHIINQNSTPTPIKEIWNKVHTTTENPEIPRKMSYDKYQIWRLKPQDDSQVKALEEYKKSEDGIKLQWLKGPSLRGLTDVLVPPKMLVDFQASLTFELIDHEVLIFDVGKAIAYEKTKEDYFFTTTQKPKKHKNKLAPLTTGMTWHKYYQYDDIIKYLETMRLRFPHLVELIHIGRSYEGRPLIITKIESKEAAAVNSAHYPAHQRNKLRHKKRIGLANAVFIEAGTHGNEWIGPATATWIINELLRIMKKNVTDDQSFIRNTTWYILPVLNPDGYVYSHEFDRFWKKSRSRHISRPSGILNSAMTWLQKKRVKDKVCFGVDLDRNWHYLWGRRGSSKTPCNEFYAGPTPFSEPETKALSEFLMDYRSQIKLFVSMQAYGQIISYPYKANTTYDTERLDDLLDVAMVGTDGLRKKGSKSRYKIDSTNDLVENRSGCSDAFAAYEAGIPFSYTLQLADNGVHGYLLPSASIESTAKDSFEIITGMLDYI